MKLQIDNLDGHGLRDYTSAIDGSRSPRVVRRLNKPAELKFSLVADGPEFLVPANGARVMLGRTNGQDVFTGYLKQAPGFEYLGWGHRGPVYRYNLVAESDELALDRKRLPHRSPFVDRGGGNALRQLTEDLLPGVFVTSAALDVDSLVWYPVDPEKKWSQHAAEIALETRASYRTISGTLSFQPVGATALAIAEADADFSPDGLSLQEADGQVNDVTVVGLTEPQDYVKDYFVGDGLTLKFYLSQIPFTRRGRILLDEEYAGTALDPTRWNATDPASAVTVSNGKLQLAGGTGVDGQSTVVFAEKIELGGALVLQHGDIAFTASSDGVLGGLYPNAISSAGCLAGFRVTPNGGESTIRALVSGAVTGTTIDTIAGHHYQLTTRFYATEIYRRRQIFHSAGHPAGNGFGGEAVAADLRVVLEVHATDPTNPATLIAPSTVLYDGVLENVSGFCSYGLVNAINLHCIIPFTRMLQPVDAEVRSALPGESYRTRLVGSQTEGADCIILSNSAVQFFPPDNVPAMNELIEVQYRGLGRSLARVVDPVRIAAQQNGSDDGVRGLVREVKAPSPRTSADCENAALALLDGSTGSAWSGEYSTWSDFLPGNADDIFPGDAVNVNVASRLATFQAIVREIEIEIKDLKEEHSLYKIRFADDVASPLAFEFQTGTVVLPASLTATTVTQVGSLFLPDLTAAEITQATSTSVDVDAGVAPVTGGGIEVRWTDFGWGQDNDRNLAGRFSTRTFTVLRLSAVQNYFLRQFDAMVPPRYSRYTTALHLKYPL
ncbi:MAG: hypothetical protein ACRD20_12510 [Terriglobales bacterium]